VKIFLNLDNLTTLRASKDRENLKREEDKKRFLKLQQETKEATQLLNFFERKKWKSKQKRRDNLHEQKNRNLKVEGPVSLLKKMSNIMSCTTFKTSKKRKDPEKKIMEAQKVGHKKATLNWMM
jgi:hypothetical protein